MKKRYISQWEHVKFIIGIPYAFFLISFMVIRYRSLPRLLHRVPLRVTDFLRHKVHEKKSPKAMRVTGADRRGSKESS